MSESRFFVPSDSSNLRGSSEPSLSSCPKAGPKHQRSNSAPARTAWLAEEPARRESKAGLQTDLYKLHRHQSVQDVHSGLSKSPARSGPRLPSSVVSESRASVEGPAPISAESAAPRFKRAIEKAEERSSTNESERGAPSANDTAGPVEKSSEQPAHVDEEGAHSKRVESDIAQWTTQRHNNVIQRSLENSDKLPQASSSPSRAAAGGEEEARGVQPIPDDQSRYNLLSC
ncbi:nascent polypeptide-associated complex alpha subunit Egd2 [Pseudozyma hubeiensis SY62]|uniref:Nascent polypeptide-associated complex alpha subunit Egd2 n=1 Tax=Pseudozyma hubeiensis (strain SY62) TaxID=1305764 RepID=R9P868_PSEHS|nr:nascent polypeptide-associated complex alpha subunit Egd2 [Pseudozyma hubeiensis SY62]GAC97534.1 nascent polypeptide-associated complex alpha subunit Egd2 [Pseudozyma hubeiensis SY62]